MPKTMKSAHDVLLENALSRDVIGAREKAPICFFAGAQPLVARMHAESAKMWNALAVMVLDPKIRAFLEENDPQALKQARRALGDLAEEKPWTLCVDDDRATVSATWCETNDCEESACHRCFPRRECRDHEKCWEFTGREKRDAERLKKKEPRS